MFSSYKYWYSCYSNFTKIRSVNNELFRFSNDLNLRDMNNLKRLECRSCKFTDQTMINLIESAPKLELLDLSHCSGITNQTLTKAATVTINRTNNMILKIFVGGTAVDLSTFDKISPFLQIVNVILLM